jgi:hypothetical protein
MLGTPGHLPLVCILLLAIIEDTNSEIAWYPEPSRMLDALHLALVIHCVYYYLVTNYANFEALTGVVWSGKVRSNLEVSAMILMSLCSFK